MRRVLLPILLVLLLGGALAVLLGPPPEGEIALGTARRHSPSAADVLARVAQGALDAAAGAAGVPEDTTDPVLSDPEQRFIELVNVDRAEQDLPPVAFDPALLTIARTRAAAQLGGPLSHFDAVGQLAFVGLLANSGVDYTLAGENLARSATNDASVAERLQQALMASPTHRANILEPVFQRIAIGAATDGSGHIAFAQIFRDVY